MDECPMEMSSDVKAKKSVLEDLLKKVQAAIVSMGGSEKPEGVEIEVEAPGEDMAEEAMEAPEGSEGEGLTVKDILAEEEAMRAKRKPKNYAMMSMSVAAKKPMKGKKSYG